MANEEYFGVVNADRVPKKAFYALRDFYGELDSLIDATVPLAPKVTDGGAFTVNKNLLYALWNSEDPESGIAQYQYKITRDSISGEVIRDWTSAGTNTYVMALGLNLAQGKAYYFTVKAKNGSGLWSKEGYSDGIILDTQPLVISNLAVLKIQPQLYRITFRLNRQAKVSAEVYDSRRRQLIARFAVNLAKNPGNNYVNFTGKDSKGNNLPGGSYFLKLKAVVPSGREFTAIKAFTCEN